MKINYHEAHLIIARRIQKKLDRIITEVMIETSSDESMDVNDRLALIEAIPLEAQDLYDRLDYSISYHEERKNEQED